MQRVVVFGGALLLVLGCALPPPAPHAALAPTPAPIPAPVPVPDAESIDAAAPAEAAVDAGGVPHGGTCEDSSDCAPGGICCEMPVPGGRRTPFASPGSASVQVCASDPRRQCRGVELCREGTCRVARPPLSADCLSQRDCPEGAQCVLYSFTALHSVCMYNPTLEHADVAPVCRTNAECDALFPRWQQFRREEERSRPWPGRCAAVPADPAHRSACVMPWTHAP